MIFGLKVDFRIASGQEGQLVLPPYAIRSNVLVAEAAHDHAGFVHGLRDGVEEASACAAAHLVHVVPIAHTVLVQEGRQSTPVHPAQARLSRAFAHGVQRVVAEYGGKADVPQVRQLPQ